MPFAGDDADVAAFAGDDADAFAGDGTTFSFSFAGDDGTFSFSFDVDVAGGVAGLSFSCSKAFATWGGRWECNLASCTKL